MRYLEIFIKGLTWTLGVFCYVALVIYYPSKETIEMNDFWYYTFMLSVFAVGYRLTKLFVKNMWDIFDD